MFTFISRSTTFLSSNLRNGNCRPISQTFFLLFSSSTTPHSLSNSSNEESFTVNYLINSCGFPLESALSTYKNLCIKNPNKPDKVLSVFKNYGFDDTQIVDVIKGFPQVLLCDPKKTLLPKLEFFSSVGFTNHDLTELVTASPRVLGNSLDNRIIPSYNIIRGLLQSDERVIRAIKGKRNMLGYNLQAYAARNIEALRKIGVPESNIVLYFTYHTSTLALNHCKFRGIVEEVTEMGFDPLKQSFIWAFGAIKSMSKSTWEKKVKLYKKWGWSEDDILVAFGKSPSCMIVSEEKLERMMDFLVNKMGVQSKVLVTRPNLFSLSLEKRIVPRSLLYQDLLSRGLIESKKEHGIHLNFWLVASEKRFLDMILKNYKDEAPQLLKLYREKMDLAK